MDTAPEKRRSLARFDRFELDLYAGDLKKNGVRIKLQRQPFEILAVLVARAGDVVTREELRSALWPTETYVDFDHGLNNSVQKLREILGDSANTPRFIETLAKRGYRFVAPVDLVDQGSADQQKQVAGSAKDTLEQSLAEIGREFLAATSEADLKKLLHRVQIIIHSSNGDPGLYEALALSDDLRRALDHSRSESFPSSSVHKQSTLISPGTAGCVFDDADALSRYDGFSRWLTLGRVRNQIILVDHTMHQKNGREIIEIISARKATPAERKAYAKNYEKKR